MHRTGRGAAVGRGIEFGLVVVRVMAVHAAAQRGVGFFVGGRGREGGFVWVEVVGVGAAVLAVQGVVAGQNAVGVEVLEGGPGDEGAEAPEESILRGICQSLPCGAVSQCVGALQNLRLKDADSHNGLACTARGSAAVRCVVGGLCSKGGQPYYGHNGIHGDEGIRLGNVGGSWVARGHYEVNPCWD